jgi:hypothetical protein
MMDLKIFYMTGDVKRSLEITRDRSFDSRQGVDSRKNLISLNLLFQNLEGIK